MRVERDSNMTSTGVAGMTAHGSELKYDRLIAKAKRVAAANAVVVHPCDETSLRGAIEAAKLRNYQTDPRRAGGKDQ